MTRLVLMALAFVATAGIARAEPAAAAWHGWEAVSLPFRSARFQYFQQGTPQEGGRVTRSGELRGYLRRAAGQRGPGPMVILLHGCTGVSELTGRGLRDWASFLAGLGVGALVLDSFAPRGVASTCGDPDGHWSQRRVDDVFSAVAFLVTARHAEPNRVVVLGQSNGGRTALNTVSVSEANRPTQLAGAVALYPYCGDDFRTTFTRPLLVVAAARDGFNPPEHCRRLDRGLADASGLRVVVIPAATHGFDIEAPGRRMVITERAAGHIADRLEFSAAARNEAREEVRRLFERIGLRR